MALILSLETSIDICSAALHENGELIRQFVINQPQAHAEKLAPAIQDLLDVAGVKIDKVSAVAVTSGPGSYTGLRIGISTAKGICFAADLPLITIPTLTLLADQALKQVEEQGLFCPMIDARRMEVYCQLFDTRLRELQPAEAKIIDNNSFKELLTAHKMFFFGNGAEKCRSVIKNPNAVFLDGVLPLATAMGSLALEKFRKSEFADLVDFRPFYLKDFVAKKAQSLLN